ncbi:GHKL domain-containing protein [Nitrosomonas sp. JL21]|uniref:ATP-binding protein n=1 Tax=Nitrosomonas sp. JL21 TaxID=153949 RepID=UPI001371B29C|nr:ATP-binding protein [Nitrosomonas sp. JL21]MBL8498011.1 GHKL domain-containing protein [Nitrosomonas sp.]MCC7090382.1 GHKL domain-containing protein [Nitrosomonas sp.]MXS78749.1 GHKL domain-containing protein [Nitrosomonas sp. JL21]
MMSLNQRVLSSAVLVLLIFIVGMALTMDRAFYDSARLGVQDRLFAKLLMIMGDTEVEESGALDVSTNLLDAEFGHVNSDAYAFILDHANTLVWRSTSSLSEQIPAIPLLAQGEKQFSQILINGQPYFMYSYRIGWETELREYPLTFSVVINTESFDAQMDRYREDLWGWLGTMVMLLLAMQMLALRWGLQPLRKVSAELAAIESGQQENLKGMYPSELRLLTDSINSLINHEHKQQKRYRNGLADLAHSLKTPLAVLQGALNSDEDESSRRKTIHEQIERMDNIVHYQLRRAATAGSSPGMGLLILLPMVNRIIMTVKMAYRSKHPEINLDIPETISLRIDEGDLMELLGNLIDNAFKWCRMGIGISATCQGNWVEIQVKDDGPGIQSHEIARILERGVRADQSTPGHGIGLAIVRDIIQVYGGELTIQNNHPTGACITLRLKKK